MTANPIPDFYLRGRGVYLDRYHLDGVDSYLESAVWSDSLEPLSDGELDDLQWSYDVQDWFVTRCLEDRGYYKK